MRSSLTQSTLTVRTEFGGSPENEEYFVRGKTIPNFSPGGFRLLPTLGSYSG